MKDTRRGKTVRNDYARHGPSQKILIFSIGCPSAHLDLQQVPCQRQLDTLWNGDGGFSYPRLLPELSPPRWCLAPCLYQYSAGCRPLWHMPQTSAAASKVAVRAGLHYSPAWLPGPQITTLHESNSIKLHLGINSDVIAQAGPTVQTCVCKFSMVCGLKQSRDLLIMLSPVFLPPRSCINLASCSRGLPWQLPCPCI